MADRYDQLADELVGGAQEEFVAELTERMAAQLEADVSNADVYRVSVAAARAEAMGVWAKFKGKVSAKAAAAFTEALSDVDEEAVVALQAGHGDALKGLSAEGVKNTIAVASDQVARLISMQNTALANTAADAYYATVADAVTRLQMGEGRNAVMERAYAKLADAGIETVDYKSGRKTLIDAAVRRHVVTQQSQCRASLLDARMDEWGHDLVYVSAHYGARPSHSAWQGKVYSRSGKDKRYASLSAATGYGTAGGLCGCNCRHTYSPYVEGVSQLPSTDWSAQEKLTGMASDAYYAATQKQRAYERQIRKVKREIATGQAHGQDMASERAYLGALQAKQRAHVKANHLTRDYAREKAYGVKQQPTALGSVLSRPAKAERAASAKAPTIDRNAAGYRCAYGNGVHRLSDEYMEGLDKGLRAGVPAVARMYKQFEGRYTAYHLKTDDGACYAPWDKSTTYHERYLEDGSQDTWFHEHGHNIDNLAGIDKGAVGRYASIDYNAGEFGATLLAEASEHVERARASCKARVIAEARKEDNPFGHLRAYGLVSAADERAYIKELDEIDAWQDKAEADHRDDRDKIRDEASRRYRQSALAWCDRAEKRKSTVALKWAHAELKNEIRVYDKAYQDISDIFDGATLGKVRGFWGHGAKYFKRPGFLSMEAFAEMTSASLTTSSGSLDKIKEYFPRSYDVFLKIVEWIGAGGNEQ